MKKLSKRQQEILDYFDDYSRKNGYPPTLREIGKKFSITSTNGSRYHLQRLKELGYIEIEPYRSRGIRRTGRDGSGNAMPFKGGFSYTLPILGQVPAGPLSLAAPDVQEDSVGVDPGYFGSRDESPNLFGLKVKGDSMIQAGIHDGDVVIVQPQEDAMNGQIVVAQVEDEATVKRFERVHDAIMLHPENPAYDPIIVRDQGGDEFGQSVGILGIVVGLIRSM